MGIRVGTAGTALSCPLRTGLQTTEVNTLARYEQTPAVAAAGTEHWRLP